MGLGNGEGGIADRGSTPVMQGRESSTLSSASPPSHTRAARKTQQNREAAHRSPYWITTLRKPSLPQVSGTGTTKGRRQAPTACGGSGLGREGGVATGLGNTGRPRGMAEVPVKP